MPRLVVFRSNKYIYAQIINDAVGETMVSINKYTDAKKAGEEIAKLALEKKVKKVVFDRNGYKYHGKVKALAQAAREAGLVI